MSLFDNPGMVVLGTLAVKKAADERKAAQRRADRADEVHVSSDADSGFMADANSGSDTYGVHEDGTDAGTGSDAERATGTPTGEVTPLPAATPARRRWRRLCFWL